MLGYCDPPTGIAEWREPRQSWSDAHSSELLAKRVLAEALRAAGRTLEEAPTADLLEQQFKRQADKWESETAFLSSTPMRVLHDRYQSIMAMGPEVVPILLRDLQKTQRHWFWALRHLTNADPVPERDKGNVDKMIAAWIEWGRREGKI